MPTNNPRLNVTLSPESMGMLANMAKADGKSMSAVARELIENLLEHEDDAYYVELSEKRLAENNPKYSLEEVKKIFGVDD